jgi:hypothetical protein
MKNKENLLSNAFKLHSKSLKQNLVSSPPISSSRRHDIDTEKEKQSIVGHLTLANKIMLFKLQYSIKQNTSISSNTWRV